MKKLILFMLVTFLSASVLYSQKLNVPDTVKSTFNTMFPNAADIKWGKENAKEYEADFKLNEVQMSANISVDGIWMETETTIDITALPEAVTDGITRDFPKAKILRAAKIDKADKNIIYETVIKESGHKKKEVEYDEKGNKVE